MAPFCVLLKCIENQNAHNLSVKYAVMYREQINCHQITCMILGTATNYFSKDQGKYDKYIFLHLTIDQGLFPVLFFINFYRALRAKQLHAYFTSTRTMQWEEILFEKASLFSSQTEWVLRSKSSKWRTLQCILISGTH